MRKIGKNGKGNGMVFGFAIVISLILVLGYFAFSQNISGSDYVDPVTGAVCDSTTTPNLTIKSFDKDNIGTALTEATNLYREKGTNSWSTFTAGTGFAVSVGKTYEIVMGITTSDFTDNAYGKVFEYKVPCEETPTIEYEMANDEIETSLTATFYNADNDAGAETFSAGDVQTVSIKLKAGVDEYFGNPFYNGMANVLVLNLNTTEWDAPESVYLADGTELKKVSTPLRHSAVAGMVNYAYEFPAIGDREVQIKMDLNADDTVAPVTDMVAHLYAGNYFINADTGKAEFGVENEEGTAVGTDASDTVTLDFTA